MSFLTFHISIFFSASVPLGALMMMLEGLSRALPSEGGGQNAVLDRKDGAMTMDAVGQTFKLSLELESQEPRVVLVVTHDGVCNAGRVDDKIRTRKVGRSNECGVPKEEKARSSKFN